MSDIKATIVILDYRKAAQVLANVRTLAEQACDFAYKIIVIDNSCQADNAKTLQSLRKCENLKLFINPKNTGYTKAYNAVKHEIEGEYVLIVNPDILWQEKDAFQKMIDYMDAHQAIGILGPKQIERNGRIAMTIRAWPKLYLQVSRRSWLRRLPIIKNKVAYDEMRHLNYGEIQDVDWLQSSCVVIRKLVWDLAGGLCEDYFLFMSDVEICYEAWRNGFRVTYYPAAKVFADGKRVSAGGFIKFFQSWVLRQHFKDSLRYRLKHIFDNDPRLDFRKRKI